MLRAEFKDGKATVKPTKRQTDAVAAAVQFFKEIAEINSLHEHATEVVDGITGLMAVIVPEQPAKPEAKAGK